MTFDEAPVAYRGFLIHPDEAAGWFVVHGRERLWAADWPTLRRLIDARSAT